MFLEVAGSLVNHLHLQKKKEKKDLGLQGIQSSQSYSYVTPDDQCVVVFFI